MKDNFNTFFRRKPALMLVALKKISRARYGSVLAKEVELGLVVFEKQGRIKLIKLTKRGREVADRIEEIRRIVG